MSLDVTSVQTDSSMYVVSSCLQVFDFDLNAMAMYSLIRLIEMISFYSHGFDSIEMKGFETLENKIQINKGGWSKK